MSTLFVTLCRKCRRRDAIVESLWCSTCDYPGIDEDYQRFRDLREEGYSAHQSLLMVGWADPPEDELFNPGRDHVG